MTLQVVVVLALADAVAAPVIQDSLNFVEQLLADERLMPTANQFSVVLYVAQVVRVTQHGAQLRVGYGTAGVAALPSLQAADRQLLGQGLQAELASGEELEGDRDERRPLRIEFDNAYVTSLAGVAGVAVADLGQADRAALLGLRSHLVCDVGALAHDLILVHGVEDRLDHVALGTFRQIEDGLHNADTPLGELPLGDRRVDRVPKDTVELVDDDEVDLVLVFLDPAHHLLEDDAPLDILGASARLDELLDDVGVHRGTLENAGVTLSRDRDAFRVVVGVHLRRRAHSQVQDGSLRGGRTSLFGGGLLARR
jgi:hypothetical protein